METTKKQRQRYDINLNVGESKTYQPLPDHPIKNLQIGLCSAIKAFKKKNPNAKFSTSIKDGVVVVTRATDQA